MQQPASSPSAHGPGGARSSHPERDGNYGRGGARTTFDRT